MIRSAIIGGKKFGYGKKIKVLLAEDHAILREGTRELVQRESNMEVFGEAGDGEEAVTVTAKLKPREIEVLKLAATGISNKDIAEQLFLSPRTVQVHLGKIFNKLGGASCTEAVLYGLKRGWLTLKDLP